MPTSGTWKLLGSTAPMTASGDIVVVATIPGYPGCMLDLEDHPPSSGQGFSHIATNPNLYLDGATTPIDYADVPPGWTPDTDYSVWLGTWVLDVGCALRVQIDALDMLDVTLTPPPAITNQATKLVPPRTGMTLLMLIGVMGWPVTLTLTSEGAGDEVLLNQMVFGGGAERDTSTPEGDFITRHGIAWIEGTYHVISSWWLIPPTDTCGNAHTSQLQYTDTVPDPPYVPLDPDDPTAAPTPTIVTVTPNHGLVAGGTPITIAGSGFGLDATVTLDSVPATDVVVVDQFTITATTPAHAGGSVDVVVTNVDGGSS